MNNLLVLTLILSTCMTASGQCIKWLYNPYTKKMDCSRDATGSGGMTWPGVSGIAQYAGSSAWGSSLGLVTTIGTPGLDTNLVTEKAIRAAISSSGVPYSGATGDVNLGTYKLIATEVQTGDGVNPGLDIVCDPTGVHCQGWGALSGQTSNITFNFPGATSPSAGQVMRFGVPSAGLSQISWGNAEDPTNKSTDTSLGGGSPSDTLYASQKAIKTYVDSHGSSSGIFQDWWIGAQMNGAFQAVGWNLSTAGTSVWSQDGRYVITFTSSDTLPSAVHFAYLPSPYVNTMAMTLKVLINNPNGGTGNVKLIAQTYCAAVGGANAQTWHGTTSATVTAPSIGTLALVTLTPLDNTGCVADSSLGVQLQRDNTVASNLADTVEIVQVGFYAQ